MANNRMFLVYRPTGDAVYLGKRMAHGWYGTPDDLVERIEQLFAKVDAVSGFHGEPSQDDFAIALEQGKRQSHVIHNWQYSPDETGVKIEKLIIDTSVPKGAREDI